MLKFFEASGILRRAGIDRNVPFHALRSTDIDSLIYWANIHKSRAPKNANGSRARYWHAYLIRALNNR